MARRRRFSVLWGRATPSASQVAFRPLAEALLSQFRDAGPPDDPELEPFRPILARLVPEWRANGPASGQTSRSCSSPRPSCGSSGCSAARTAACSSSRTFTGPIPTPWRSSSTWPTTWCRSRSCACAPSGPRSRARRLPSPAASSPGVPPPPSNCRPSRGPQVSAMARACLDLPSLPREFDAILQECSDGLPFLVEELLAGAAGAGVVVRADHGWRVEPGFEPAVPRTFVATVVERLGALGPTAAAALGAAAVLGRRFDWTTPSAHDGPERAGGPGCARAGDGGAAARLRATGVRLVPVPPRAHTRRRPRPAAARRASPPRQVRPDRRRSGTSRPRGRLVRAGRTTGRPSRRP